MFQKNRPSVSNRFQADSSSTSMETCFMASVTLRPPASKAAWMAAVEAEHQQAQRGSSRPEASGTMIAASLERARSVRKRRNSVVRKGMSQLRIKAKEHGSRSNSGVLSRESVSLRRWRAVRIPPRGPWPGQRSAITGHGASAYFPAAATMVTSWQTLASNSPVRWSIVFPSSRTSALSVPKRVLPPPACTKPWKIILPPREFPGPAGEYPVREAAPANSAGAGQSSPPCAKYSTDARQAGATGTQFQTCAWLRENPSPSAPGLLRWQRPWAQQACHATPLPANHSHQSLRHARAPGYARSHSSTRARSPANRSSPAPSPLPSQAAAFAPAALHAAAQTLPQEWQCPPCVPAAVAIQSSPPATDKKGPREIFRRGSPAANSDAS